MKFIFFLIAIFVLAPGSKLYSQETQIPIDSARKINIINKELERKLNLFPEYEKFQEAKLFRTAEGSYIFEITYEKDGFTVRDKKEMTQRQLEEFRMNLQSLVVSKAPAAGLDQTGRASFLTGTTLLSLGYYGWSVPNMLNAKDEVAVGLYLVTAGAGFFVPYMLTKETEVTKGMSNLSIGAATIGLGHGALLWDLTGLSDSDEYGDYNGRSLNLFMTVTSLSEMLTGYFFAENNNVSEGRANAIVTSSVVGGLYGGGLGYLISGDDPETWHITLPVLLGSGGGAVYGNYLANRQNFAPGDAVVMSNAGILGGMAGGTLMAYIEPDEGRVVVGTLMATSALGFYLGSELINGYDFSNNTATYISLGTIGGGLVGAGISTIILKDADFDTGFKIGATIVTGMAALGYGITYMSLRDDARVSKGTSSLNWNINPTGFFAGNINRKMGTSIPFFTLQYKFK